MRILFIGPWPDEATLERLSRHGNKLSRVTDTAPSLSPSAGYGDYDPIIITDASLPELDGLIGKIRADYAGARIIIATTDGSIDGVPREILNHRPMICATYALPNEVEQMKGEPSKGGRPVKSDEVHACG